MHANSSFTRPFSSHELFRLLFTCWHHPIYVTGSAHNHHKRTNRNFRGFLKHTSLNILPASSLIPLVCSIIWIISLSFPHILFTHFHRSFRIGESMVDFFYYDRWMVLVMTLACRFNDSFKCYSIWCLLCYILYAYVAC